MPHDAARPSCESCAIRSKPITSTGPIRPRPSAFLLPHLGHADRHIRYAARVALEHMPVDTGKTRVLGSSDIETVITGVVGLARQAEPALKPKLLAALGKLDFAKLTEMQQLELLRAYQLVLIRLGLPEETAPAALADKFEALFPASSEMVNRELAILMVALGSPERGSTSWFLPLTRERVMIAQDYGDVLTRNAALRRRGGRRASQSARCAAGRLRLRAAKPENWLDTGSAQNVFRVVRKGPHMERRE